LVVSKLEGKKGEALKMRREKLLMIRLRKEDKTGGFFKGKFQRASENFLYGLKVLQTCRRPFAKRTRPLRREKMPVLRGNFRRMLAANDATQEDKSWCLVFDKDKVERSRCMGKNRKGKVETSKLNGESSPAIFREHRKNQDVSQKQGKGWGAATNPHDVGITLEALRKTRKLGKSKKKIGGLGGPEVSVKMARARRWKPMEGTSTRPPEKNDSEEKTRL